MKQRNKYLDDLGLKINEYGTNFTVKNDNRESKWKEERKLYGFDSRETWNLNDTFIEWLYSRLMMYKEQASNIIDMSFYTYDFNGKTYDLGEAIDYIIENCKVYLTSDFRLDMQVTITLFGIIHTDVWW